MTYENVVRTTQRELYKKQINHAILQHLTSRP